MNMPALFKTERPIEKITSEIERLDDQRQPLVAQIDRHDETLAVSEDAQALQTAFFAKLGAERKLERLDAKIAEAQERLRVAKDAAKERERLELIAALGPLGADLLVKGRAASDAFTRYIAARDAIDAAGYQRDYVAAPMPPAIAGGGLVAPDLLDRFEDSLNPTQPTSAKAGLRRVERQPRVRPTGHSIVGHHLGTKITDAVGPVSLAFSPAVKSVKRPPRCDIVADGEVLATVVRVGVELPDGTQGAPGDVVSMPKDQAVNLVRGGGMDFVAPGEAVRADAESAPRIEAAE